MLWLAALVMFAGAPSKLTLPEAIDRALAAYPDTRIAALAREEALARRASATGALFPRLRVEAGLQVWDRPLTVKFTQEAAPGEEQPDLSFLPPSFRSMLDRMQEPSQVRDAFTANASVTVAQPLTPLYALLQARRLEARGVDASAAQQSRAEIELAFKVTEAYVQALMAEAGARTAERGIALATQLMERAEQLAKAGIVANADVLRAKVNLANVREASLNARVGVELSRAALAMYLGAAPDETFSLEEETREWPPPPALDDALAAAKSARPELLEIDARLEQADAAVHLARSRMIPDLTILGQYQFTHGQKFAQQNQVFFGASLGWDVWEWGNKWYLIDAAKAKAEAARLERAKLADLLLLDVRQAHTRHAIAAESAAAAKVALEAAKEFLDNEQGRYGAGQVTATDLAMAQTNFLQAENNFVAARLKIVLARAALDKAIGRRPLRD
ncbi:MAG: TolC family protein [Deltaproteobacteria bacterium]|nr:TolC family protein [Deltaproteobacteria bacterium]